MNLTITDCVAMHDLLKYHKSWNNGEDWFWGSPSLKQVKYVIPDQGVTVIRQNMQGIVGPNNVTYMDRFVRMNWMHDDFLLEAQWCDSYSSDIWDALVDQGRWNDEFIQLQWIHYVGDPHVFASCLTEFKLWNSLTDYPVIY